VSRRIPRPLRRSLRAIAPGLVLVAYAIFLLSWFWSVDWRPDWDGALYLLLGQSLARGEGYAYLDQPFFLRPPGFPWLLSFFTEGGPYPPRLLTRLPLCFAAASVAAIYLALRSRHGRWRALAVALLSGTSALFTGIIDAVLSDLPFLFLLFAALGLLDASLRREARWWIPSLLGAIALAGAAYLRTAALVLLPALVLVPFLTGRRNAAARAGLPTLVALVLILPWLLYVSRAAAGAETPSDQLLLFDYRTAILHLDAGDPTSPVVSGEVFLARTLGFSVRLARELSALLLHSRRMWAAGLVALVVLAGFARCAVRKLSIFEGFAAAYSAVVVTYFTYDSRLVVPLAPFAYLYSVEAISAAASTLARVTRDRVRRWSAPAILALAVTAVLAANLSTLPGREPSRPLGYGELGRWLRENTPEGTVILCEQAPIVSYVSGRRAYTYLFPRSDDLLTRYDVDYVVLSSRPPARVAMLAQQRALERWDVAGWTVFRVSASP
jgi:4-amino-4-deoxy-L-arabinose transferase-like glycosyltransferase